MPLNNLFLKVDLCVLYIYTLICMLHNCKKKKLAFYYDRTDEACISLTSFNGRLNNE